MFTVLVLVLVLGYLQSIKSDQTQGLFPRQRRQEIKSHQTYHNLHNIVCPHETYTEMLNWKFRVDTAWKHCTFEAGKQS